jgi:hypothetical protein
MKPKTEPQTTTAPDYVLAVAPAEQLQAAIAAVVAERDAYIVQVNQQLAYFNGKIDALRSLLPAPAAPAPAPDEPPNASPA